MFAVTWPASVANELAKILLADMVEAADMEAAVLAMNARLAVDPFAEGESRSAGFRVVFARPDLIIYVFVDEPQRVVEAVSVHRRA